MAPMFKVGEIVVCVDASDLPTIFVQLHTGTNYIIRSVYPVMSEDAFNSNIHKNSKYCVRLFGIINSKLPNGLERAYMETRFEKFDDGGIKAEVKEKKTVKV